MHSVFFENIHTASADFPYIDTEMRDINYLAHFHDEIEIVVVVSGSTDIKCDNSCFTAKEGDICIFMPAEIHSFVSHTSNHLYILKLHCENSREKTNFSNFRLQNNVIKKEDSLYSFLRARIENLIAEIVEQKPGYGYMTNSIAQEILAHLLRRGQLSKIDPDLRKKQFLYVDLLKQVADYVDENYALPISLSDISTHCNFSAFYFAHIFKAATGSSFLHYLTAYRLDKALTLLQNPDNTVLDVALACGFSCSRSFNRAFQKFFSETPGEYRKKSAKAFSRSSG